MGILADGFPTNLCNWILFILYNIPFFTLLWHLSDYIVYKCYMEGWKKLGYPIDKLSWLSGIAFYILSPILLPIIYRALSKIASNTLEKEPPSKAHYPSQARLSEA